MSPERKKYLSYAMWLLPLSFFTYQFILRLWPSLMMQQIMQQFRIDATGFGFLAAIYYYGYAGMQIPIAILLDRYGPRYLVFGCAVICGVATYIFSYTDHWVLALLSRFLIGVASAVGFLGTSKVISQWFPKSQYARMIGYTFTLGLLGAIYGGKPISLLVEGFGWQKVAVILAVVSLSIGVSAYLFLSDPSSSCESQETSHMKLVDFKQLMSSPILWLLAAANLLMVGSLEGFADVWGVNYLMTAYALTKADAAELISFIFVGMLFGGPLLAYLSKKFGNYSMISFCGLGMAAIFFQLIFYLPTFNWIILASLFFLSGILCCYQVIVFAAGCTMVDTKLLGVTVAFLNCINMLGGSFFHSLIGFMMDVFWAGQMNEDLRLYTLESYKYALLVIPVCALIGTSIVIFVGLRLRNRSWHMDKVVA